MVASWKLSGVIWRDGVGVRLDQSEERVRDAGLGGEIVHFVVE